VLVSFVGSAGVDIEIYLRRQSNATRTNTMASNRYHRQSFLGERSEEILSSCRVAIVGLGGGGSHVAQQLAHIGVGTFVVADPDIVEESNLNRLVGATAADVKNATPKVDIAERLIRAVNPAVDVLSIRERWQAKPELFRDCDLIFGCVDGYAERDELERMSRRFLIPYIDIGMDVHRLGKRYLISGQAALSMPGEPCLWCIGLLTEELLAQEAANYGQAGGRPQVIWTNGVLASTAIGLFLQLVTPWHDEPIPILMEYDGNSHSVLPSNKLAILSQKVCRHHEDTDVGDPFFK
jgi:hypothetical protein